MYPENDPTPTAPKPMETPAPRIAPMTPIFELDGVMKRRIMEIINANMAPVWEMACPTRVVRMMELLIRG